MLQERRQRFPNDQPAAVAKEIGAGAAGAARRQRRPGKRATSRRARPGHAAATTKSMRRRYRAGAASPESDASAQHGLGGVRALVALAAAGAGERLLHVLDGQHAERARHAGAQLDVLDPARGLGADVVVVVGLAADHRAEAGDAGVAAASRPGSCAASGSSNAPGTSNTSASPSPAVRERALRARHQPLGQLLVEARRRRSRSARSLAAPRPPRGRATCSSCTISSSSASALVVERVAQAVALGAQVGLVVRVRRVLDRDLRGDRQPVALQAADLLRVVGEDADRASARGRRGSARRCRSRAGRPAGRARGSRRPCRAPGPAGCRRAACSAGRSRGPPGRGRAARRGPRARSSPAPTRAARRSRSAASGRRRRSGTPSARARARRRRPRRRP